MEITFKSIIDRLLIVITPLKHIIITLVLLAITGCSATVLPDPEEAETYSRPDSSSSSSSSSTSSSSSRRTAYTKPYKIKGKYYHPLASSQGFVQQGIASWYGEQFHGRKTANGETYNMYGVSAAHKTLPLGTWVRVYNLENSKTLDLRINDRGPFVTGRIIDLSYKAAQMLGVAGPGTAQVKVVALGEASGSDKRGNVIYKPVDYFKGNFTVQVGAFTVRANAQKLKIKLGRKYINSHINEYTDARGKFYRVRVGRFRDLDAAERFNEELTQAGAKNSFVVAE
ncbi:MAG: septal ring lytic transglycosylase RlpA family protein [Desulfamplus sp.]|nr:septal ring lytic transglycosylase RlpA family protein [Desulfamplus sp.]MBF0413811.1 septal ring lytic transglycosylase RlpA family protein [Desulfamplus sp.]